jgi:hypothetical protein
LREGDRGSCRPSGPIRPFEVAEDAAREPLTEPPWLRSSRTDSYTTRPPRLAANLNRVAPLNARRRKSKAAMIAMVANQRNLERTIDCECGRCTALGPTGLQPARSTPNTTASAQFRLLRVQQLVRVLLLRATNKTRRMQ